MLRRSPLPALLLLAALQTDARVARLPEQPHAASSAVRGITISTQTDGREWASPAMGLALREVRELGANWVAIHPYGWLRRDGTVVSSTRGDRAETWIRQPIAEAQRLGLKVFVKPHIGYWGSGFGWRGAIRFEDEASWQRFFSSYERWISEVALAASQADGFAVGTELEGTVGHEAAWRRIIARVRERTPAPLTYAANWDRYQRVPFWDALDAIGIQAYFPLSDREGLPSGAELRAAWDAHVAQLERFSERHGKPVVLTELGYNRSALAAVRPWEYRQGGPHAEELQQRCLDAALERIAHSEKVVGAFLWKWFAGPAHGEDFLLSEPPLRRVIGERWSPAPR